MNKLFITLLVFAAMLTACSNSKAINNTNKIDSIGFSGEPLAFTIYSDKVELFIEFKPLIIGNVTTFAAHFTTLGDSFKPITSGTVKLTLVGEGAKISNFAAEPSSPGIFRFSLTPKKSGKYDLVFDIKTEDFVDTISIKNIFVYANLNAAESVKGVSDIGDEISYLKEQAWEIEFANKKIVKQPFSEIIKTTGVINSAQGDEIILTAKSSGIINIKKNILVGSLLEPNETIFIISGSGLIEGNLDAKYYLAKANLKKSESDYSRAKELVKSNIISKKKFQTIKLKCNNDRRSFDYISKNYKKGGQSLSSPVRAYIKKILIIEGQYVKIGEPIAVISQNKKLVLNVELPLKYIKKLSEIRYAKFKTSYGGKVFNTKKLNGKIISYGKTINNNAYFLPVNFEIDKQECIIVGSFVEVYLVLNKIEDALVIPISALVEEQGSFFAYVQTSGEGFQKRVLKLGASDGENIQVVSGIKEFERVVIKGAHQLKLATSSGKIPTSGHAH